MLTNINNDRPGRVHNFQGNVRMKSKIMVAVGAFALCTGSVSWAAGVDAAAAEALMKKSGCGKCHSVSAKKEGPAYKETAAKLKGKAGAEDELFKHLTTNPKVKVEGQEEEHPSLKTKNDADVKNVVGWILSQ